jgi:hypothetical protein
LIICCSTIETPSHIWYIDGGASIHISGVREKFTNLRYPNIKLDIMLGDNTIVKAAVRGIVSFQRELMPPLVFRDVLYVPKLKKNMISISSIKYRGFEVSFRGIKVLIHPKGSSVTSDRVIWICEVNLYKLIFHPLHDLASRNNNSHLCQPCIEGWLICIMEL